MKPENSNLALRGVAALLAVLWGLGIALVILPILIAGHATRTLGNGICNLGYWLREQAELAAVMLDAYFPN